MDTLATKLVQPELNSNSTKTLCIQANLFKSQQNVIILKVGTQLKCLNLSCCVNAHLNLMNQFKLASIYLITELVVAQNLKKLPLILFFKYQSALLKIKIR